jgi:hypothetical protein
MTEIMQMDDNMGTEIDGDEDQLSNNGIARGSDRYEDGQYRAKAARDTFAATPEQWSEMIQNIEVDVPVEARKLLMETCGGPPMIGGVC